MFCQPQECANRCGMDDEENEDCEDFLPDKNVSDDMPIGRPVLNCEFSQALGLAPAGRGWEGHHVKLSTLPWADLHGIQQESLETASNIDQLLSFSSPATRRQAMDKSASPVRSLLPLASTNFSLNNMPRVRFLTGIPTKANLYKPEPSDPIDVEVHHALQQLDAEASCVLALRRVEPGRYEIDGRIVLVYWHPSGAHVRENEVDGPSMVDMPLQPYINLVANVALDLQHSAADNSWFQNVDLFFDVGASKTTDRSLEGEDRYRAMQIACMQAKMRELGPESQSLF